MDLTHIAQVARAAKISDHSNLKILTPKQMFQRLPKALEQVNKLDIFCIKQKKLLEKYIKI